MSDRSTQTVLSEASKDVAVEVNALQAPDVAIPATIATATHSEGTGRNRGPVPKRRYQAGCFRVENGKAYTIFYRDVQLPDGRSGPSERATVTAISHPCQSVKPAADTIYSWRPSIGNAVASRPRSKVKHFETPLMLGAVQWLLNSHRRQ